jgi:hypothetical protein
VNWNGGQVFDIEMVDPNNAQGIKVSTYKDSEPLINLDLEFLGKYFTFENGASV